MPDETQTGRFGLNSMYEVWFDDQTSTLAPNPGFLEFLGGEVTFLNIDTNASNPRPKLTAVQGPTIDSASILVSGSSTSLTVRGVELEAALNAHVLDGASLNVDGSHAKGSLFSAANNILLDGNLDVTGGGQVQAFNIVGGGQATITVSGPGSHIELANGLRIGNEAMSFLNIDSGATVSALGVGINSGGGSISGAGSRLDADQQLFLGGNFDINSGGHASSQFIQVINSTGDRLLVAGGSVTALESVVSARDFGGNSNTAEIANGGQWDSDSFIVGNSAFETGTVNVTAGGTVNTSTTEIGKANSNGTISVSGSGAQWNNLGNFDIGLNGTADLSVSDQGSVFIGQTMRVGARGTVSLLGGLVDTDQLEIQEDGQFSLGGGTLSVRAVHNFGSLDLDSGILNLTDTNGTNLNADVFGPKVTLENVSLNVQGEARIDNNLEVEIHDTSNFSATSVRNEGVISVINSATLGNSNRHDGYAGTGTLNVRGAATLQDAGLAQLGNLTTIDLGSLQASNGFAIGSGGTLTGNGIVDGRISGTTGSAIYADGGNLTVGDASHVAGFASQGELYVGDNIVWVLDANQAQLGSYTEIGTGSSAGILNVANGAVLDFGDNLVGVGRIENGNAIETAIINNGLIAGNSASDRLVITGYVKGVGTFDNVQFDGTFSPGLSPTITRGTNFFFGDSSVLEMEIGGLVPGDEHDAIWASGLLSLDGTLEVLLIDGFDPSLGDSFDLFDWGSIEGSFDNFILPELATGLHWDTSDLYSTGVLSISAVPEPTTLAISGLICIGLIVRRRRNAFTIL